MRLYALTALFVFMTSGTVGAESPIVKCKMENRAWQGLIMLDANGAGLLKFKKKEGKKVLSCPLALEFIDDNSKGVSPKIIFDFVKGECSPSDKAMEGEVFKQVTLIINLLNKKHPTGRVQWLKKFQPDECKVEKFKRFDVYLNIKKWKKGLWGRSTASDEK